MQDPIEKTALGTGIPQNQEHLEAAQNDTNEYRKRFIKSLSLEDQNKFAAVEKAVNIMVEAGVPFYLYPILPNFQDPSLLGAWQWNSLLVPEVVKVPIYDKRGKLTNAFCKINSLFHELILTAIFNGYIAAANKNHLSDVDQWKYFIEMLGYALTQAANYRWRNEIYNKHKEEVYPIDKEQKG